MKRFLLPTPNLPHLSRPPLWPCTSGRLIVWGRRRHLEFFLRHEPSHDQVINEPMMMMIDDDDDDVDNTSFSYPVGTGSTTTMRRHAISILHLINGLTHTCYYYYYYILLFLLLFLLSSHVYFGQSILSSEPPHNFLTLQRCGWVFPRHKAPLPLLRNYYPRTLQVTLILSFIRPYNSVRLSLGPLVPPVPSHLSFLLNPDPSFPSPATNIPLTPSRGRKRASEGSNVTW